ncbi:hypothetical protein AX17_002636 [Amanita inopinata Kibby_2008]|nr:hypothetical protein AX17_002636 [Amanita inopinata Kibby_2008]
MGEVHLGQALRGGQIPYCQLSSHWDGLHSEYTAPWSSGHRNQVNSDETHRTESSFASCSQVDRKDIVADELRNETWEFDLDDFCRMPSPRRLFNCDDYEKNQLLGRFEYTVEGQDSKDAFDSASVQFDREYRQTRKSRLTTVHITFDEGRQVLGEKGLLGRIQNGARLLHL